MGKLKEIIKRSKNEKVHGSNDLNAEFINYGRKRLHEEIYQLIGDTWREENMPKEWE